MPLKRGPAASFGGNLPVTGLTGGSLWPQLRQTSVRGVVHHVNDLRLLLCLHDAAS